VEERDNLLLAQRKLGRLPQQQLAFVIIDRRDRPR